MYACTLAAMFAVALSFAGRQAEALSRLIIGSVWLLTIVAVPLVRTYTNLLVKRGFDLKAPPGITGLWQVSGRNNLPFEQRLRLDEYYVRNWSLWLDLVVLLKTAGAVVRGRGAY